MKNKLLVLTLIFFSILLAPKKIFAIEDPRNVPNNRFGIHILDENDLEPASKLINSEGGDWGHVTVVIREDERRVDRWQKVFDKMRRLHLIPVVRIAGLQTNSHWTRFEKEKINEWVDFLDSLNWVVQNRYVIIGNEVNHASEWGNELNPEEYSDYLLEISKKLKEKSNNFFVLPAGFDASAPNDKEHMREDIYLQKMLDQNPDLFEHVDGWVSHSYPNPDFSGSAEARGRGTVRTYQWELKYIKSLGIEKDLPVFITETGWAHDIDEKTPKYQNSKSPSEISEKLKTAYKNAWNSENVVAVTPFVLNYQGEPFDIFSWTKSDGSHYSFYNEIKNMPKIKGRPERENLAEIITVLFPEIIKRKDNKYGIGYVKNTGQIIWKTENVQNVIVDGKRVEVEPISYKDEVAPFQSILAFFRTL